MTTEILRNMFYLQPPENLGYVVLDECHYMGDEGRGRSGRRSLSLSQRCPLVALSAQSPISTRSLPGSPTSIVRSSPFSIRSVRSPWSILVDPQGNIMRARDMVTKGPCLLKDDGGGIIIVADNGLDPAVAAPTPGATLAAGDLFIFSRAGCEAVLRRCFGGRQYASSMSMGRTRLRQRLKDTRRLSKHCPEAS